MKYLRKTLAAIAISFLVISPAGFVATAEAVPLNVPAPVVLADSQGDACAGLNQLGGTGCQANNPKNTGQDAIAKIARTVVNIISFIAGIAAVILIVISGIKFITSGGDSNGVASAKNTMIYALIGLLVVALAQIIVHFVLNAVLNNNVTAG